MSWELIAGVAGAVVLIGNAGFEAIKEMREAIERSDQVNQLHLNVMLKMLNHMIDGNGKEEMRKTRDDIQDMLAGIEK